METIEDLERSRDNQWASGDRDFAFMNDAKVTVLRELEQKKKKKKKVGK